MAKILQKVKNQYCGILDLKSRYSVKSESGVFLHLFVQMLPSLDLMDRGCALPKGLMPE